MLLYQGVIWITGLPGSGKSTLARSLVERLKQEIDTGVVLLDGDEMRNVLESQAYESSERQRLAAVYQRLAEILTNQGFVVVVATVSLFHEIQDSNRKRLRKYLEVFLDVPQESLAKGPRSKIYMGPPLLDPSQNAEFPMAPDVCLCLDKDGGRSHWLRELTSAIGIPEK